MKCVAVALVLGFVAGALGASSTGWATRGCRSSASVRRAFEAAGEAADVDACLAKCQAKGRDWVMGALQGPACHCGTRALAKRLAKAPSRRCHKRCSGLACGGQSHASLYQFLGQAGEAIRFTVRVIKAKNGGA